MRAHARHRRTSNDPVIVAGWVFADLLLALCVVLLASQVLVPEPTPAEPTPKPTVKNLATMEKTPKTRNLQVDPERLISGQKRERTRFARQLSRVSKGLRKRQRKAAMVLVWGYSPDDGRGIQIAEAVSRRLEAAPGTLFSKARVRSLWKGGDEGQVELEMYLYKQERGQG